MKVAALTLALAATAYSQNDSSALNLTAALAAQPSLSNLTSYFGTQASQLGSIPNVTLLAPNNEAFAAFLNATPASALNDQNLVSAILNYHVLNGTYSNFTNNSTDFIRTGLLPGLYANVTGGQRVGVIGGSNTTFISGLLQTSNVVNTTTFNNGVIHIVNKFLVVPENVSATAVALNLTSAVGALTNTSLAATVDTTADLTIFVPNNAAFQRIGGNLANLSTAELAGILRYHVVPSLAYSSTLTNGSFPTLNGTNLTITIEGSSVYVNNARVIQPNVLVSNGVVHVIDRVLNPSNTTATPNSATTEESYPSATSASDVPFTSGVATPTSAIDTSAAASATSSGGAFRPLETGAIGMAALFGGAAAVLNM